MLVKRLHSSSSGVCCQRRGRVRGLVSSVAQGGGHYGFGLTWGLLVLEMLSLGSASW